MLLYSMNPTAGEKKQPEYVEQRKKRGFTVVLTGGSGSRAGIRVLGQQYENPQPREGFPTDPEDGKKYTRKR